MIDLLHNRIDLFFLGFGEIQFRQDLFLYIVADSSLHHPGELIMEVERVGEDSDYNSGEKEDHTGGNNLPFFHCIHQSWYSAITIVSGSETIIPATLSSGRELLV